MDWKILDYNPCKWTSVLLLISTVSPPITPNQSGLVHIDVTEIHPSCLIAQGKIIFTLCNVHTFNLLILLLSISRFCFTKFGCSRGGGLRRPGHSRAVDAGTCGRPPREIFGKINFRNSKKIDFRCYPHASESSQNMLSAPLRLFCGGTPQRPPVNV